MKYKGISVPSVKHILNRVNYHAEPISKQYGIPNYKLQLGFLKSFVKTGCSALDYFLYKFFLLNNDGQKQFVTVKQRTAYEHKHNNLATVKEILNKETALLKFADFVDRDWCGQKYHNTEEDFEEFAQKHEKCIIKPMEGKGGNGAQIISTRFHEGKSLYQICKERNAIAEELIIQHEDIMGLYANSVNTIRILTLKGKVVAAGIRMGAGGSQVDNAHFGGVFAEIDAKTGIIIGEAIKTNGEKVIKHPDTGVVIPGFQVPFWNEVITLSEDAAKLISDISIVGWDIAVTSKGPTVVEANSRVGLELIQAPNGHGLKDIFEKILG